MEDSSLVARENVARQFLHHPRSPFGPPRRCSLGSRGQSLLEVLVTMAIAIIIVAGLVAAVIVAVRNAQFAKNQVLATKYANEGMENIRAYRDQSDWDVFKSGCSSYNLGLVPSPFTRPPASCQEIDPNKMKVTVTVSWTDSIGPHQSKLVSYFTKPTTWK